MMRKLLNQTGDTILEVLLAMLVAVAVLSAAYVSSNSSTNATIRAREHDEGVKLAQAQIEMLRFRKVNAGTNNPFCMVNSGVSVKPVSYTSGGGGPLPFLPGFVPSAFCIVDSQGNVYGATGEGAKYYLAIQNTTAGLPEGNLYKVTVFWEKAGGGNDRIDLWYRMHP